MFVQEDIEGYGAELFLKLNVPSGSLHLWYKETGPLTKIHLYDLKGPQDLASQYLYDFIFCSP